MSSGEDSGERNPFAPPPPGAPDQPWRPRVPQPPTDGPDGERPEGERTPWGRPQPEQPAGPKLDPSDPLHRTARNALLCGFASLLAVLATFPWIGFPLGLLAVWYAVTVLRTPAEPVADPFAPRPVRPQVPAALSALITGGLALVMSLSVFALQFAYHDYLDCVAGSLTKEGAQSCAVDERAPAWLVTMTEGADQ
ncbi:hypothetical protein [Kitasatospora sp. NPDC088134]|uniref:hypothetical protein n=1 Tax=Kitasatospora sp. NPDC088134 TaxID=3364071 RepID=UPI00381CCAF0